MSAAMVSVQQQQQSQYITDFNSPISSMDKSPLAMLEKTCETIGLSDTPSKKSSPKSKETSPSVDTKKKEVEAIVTKSPRLNPVPSIDKKLASCEPSTSMAAPGMFPGTNPAMLQRCFPFSGIPGVPTHMMPGAPMGFPGMMPPYLMPQFMPPTSMNPMLMTPHMPNGRPCTTPNCSTCASLISMNPFVSPEMMFAAYSNSMNMAAMSAMAGGKHVCSYAGCGKVFTSEADHLVHLKSHVSENSDPKATVVQTAPAVATNSASSGASETTSRNSTPSTEKKPLTSPKNGSNGNNRFHPYMKDSRSATPNSAAALAAAAAATSLASNNQALNMATQMAMLMNMNMMPPMGPGPMVPPTAAQMGFPGGMPGLPPQFNPAAIQAMLAQQQRGMH